MAWLSQIDLAIIRCSHLSYQEMGERLGMNPRTVKAHTDKVRLKLGVANKRHIKDRCRELDIKYKEDA